MRKRRRCAIPNFTDLTLTSPRSPRSGDVAASSAHGCSISPPRRCARILSWLFSRDALRNSGEGRWTLQAAIDEGVPVPVLSAALFERFEFAGAGGLRQ